MLSKFGNFVKIWKFGKTLKFGPNFEIWLKFWNLVKKTRKCKNTLWKTFKIFKFGWNFEIWSKFWNLVNVLKFGQNLVEMLKFGQNLEIWLKFWNFVKIFEKAWWWWQPPWWWWGPQKHCWGVIQDDFCTEGRPEIGNPKVWPNYLPTNLLTWVGARDTCMSKKESLLVDFYY